MPIKLIPLSQLETDPKGTLNECLDTGASVVVEMPDHRMVSIQALEAAEDDELVDELIETNAAFRQMLTRSAVSDRRPFPIRESE